jgi:hypothetical protein
MKFEGICPRESKLQNKPDFKLAMYSFDYSMMIFGL